MKNCLLRFFLFFSFLFFSQLIIAQNCSLGNPDNMVVGGKYYFKESVTITTFNAGETWEINNINGGDIHILPLPNPQTAPINIPETSSGVYALEFWVLNGETVTYDAERTSPSSFLFSGNTAGGCTNPAFNSMPASIPTLSEWGLIILALLLMTLGTLYLVQPSVREGLNRNS